MSKGRVFLWRVNTHRGSNMSFFRRKDQVRKARSFPYNLKSRGSKGLGVGERGLSCEGNDGFLEG